MCCLSLLLLQLAGISDNSEMVDAKETPLAAVIDDSCTVQYIEITPLDRPSDDCYKSECIDPVVEVKPEDLQDVKQEPVDEIDNEVNIPHYAVKVRFWSNVLNYQVVFDIFELYYLLLQQHNLQMSRFCFSRTSL